MSGEEALAALVAAAPGESCSVRQVWCNNAEEPVYFTAHIGTKANGSASFEATSLRQPSVEAMVQRCIAGRPSVNAKLELARTRAAAAAREVEEMEAMISAGAAAGPDQSPGLAASLGGGGL